MKGFSAIILAGGKSSRMGTDKMHLQLNGKSFLEHALSLVNHFDDILVSTNSNLLLEDRIVAIEDVRKNLGPLGGLVSCLPKIKNESALILGIDTPLLKPEIIYPLLKEYREGVLVAKCANQVHPLVGIYSKQIMPQLKEYLESGKRSVIGFNEAIEAEYYEYEKRYSSFFENINTPEEFEFVKHES